MENTVIVVGAGAAGLMAAYTLSKHNKKVILLEALNRPGGRIHTHSGNGFSSHIEAGAEFIHGDLKLTKKLLNKAGVNYTPVKGEMFSVQNGKFFKQEQTHWDEVMEKMEALDTDVTLLDFLTDNFKGEEYASLRRSVTGFAEGFDLADVSKASTKSLYKEWSHEDEMQYRVDGGYNQLIYFLEAESKKNGCIIYNNCCVKKINWCKNEVSVLTMCSRFFKAEKIIIAVPLSVLQSSKNETGYIDFAPAVNAYTEAANNIGFGSVIKIIIEFDEAFWNSYKRNTGFFLIEEIIPTWWTQMPDNKPVLTGWLSGEKAGALQHKSNEEIFEASIQSLASAFALKVETVRKKVVAHYVANWQNMPGIFGAYSYNTLNSVTAKQILNNAVEETVYFAGEALYDGKALGTVEAALISGERAALKMMYDN